MRLYCSRPLRAERSPPSALALHSTCANGILYYIYAATPSTARPRITVRRRRAAPGTPTDRDPWEDVTRPCNANDAAVLVVPCPAPSLSTASQPLLVPQLYRKSRRVVLSRAIDLSYFAGRAAPGPGRAGPALHPDGTTAVPGLVRDVSASPKAARSRQRIARSPPPAALPDAAQRWRGAAAPLQQLLRRGAARRRARAHSVDGWTTVYDQDGRPRAMPDELVGAPANRCCALLRQHDEPPYTLQPQNRAARDEGVAHTLPTHYERDATAGTREADGTLQICMRRRAFKLRRARIAARATARPSA